ncbi:type IV secretion system protein [Hydrogenophaga sp. MI9]|uniref:type IV secretion system protein n=1 Tax=Hydrogenophaga sp. MI9 TaxID=3453719 RepID=UPI003EEA69E9
MIEDQLQGIYQHGAARELAKVIGVMSSTFVTLWVMVQGFKIINGTMRTPILELGFQAAKMILVLSLISLTLANTPWITETVTNFQEAIAIFLTGTSTPIDSLIDFNVAATSLIDLVVQDVSGKSMGGTGATLGGSNTLTAGWLGQAGPAVTAATLLMMARVAIVFGIMLSPLFLFFSMFEKTNGLFWQWVKYLLSIFFAMAALSIVTVIALQAMSQYGFFVFLSMLVNQMDPGIFRALLVSVITGTLSGPDATVDVGGGLTRLATMGAFFTGLIMAVPAIVMTYFGAAMNLAAQGLGSMMGNSHPPASAPQGASPGVGDTQQLYNEQRLAQSNYANNTSYANVGGNSPSLSAGNQTLNQQAMQHIASRNSEAAQYGQAGGAVTAAQRQPIGMANDTRFQSGQGGQGNLSMGAREKAGASDVRLSNISASSQGLPSSTAAQGSASIGHDSGSYNPAQVGSQPAAALPPSSGGNPTPVHAMPPPGAALPRSTSEAQVIEVPARVVSSAELRGAVRPGSAQQVTRPQR